jgi:ribosomal protein S27E
MDHAAPDGGALDGNAIGGLLWEVFGTEMTEARARCATCGAAGPMAETVVYQRAPGTVVRCRSCGAVLMVVVRHRQQNCVDLLGLAALEPQ